MSTVLAIGSLYAVGVTKAVDFVRTAFDRESKAADWVWIALAFAFGVGLALVLRAQLANLALASLASSLAAKGAEVHPVHLNSVLDEVLTGLAIGGAASFWHHGLALLKAHTVKANSNAGVSR